MYIICCYILNCTCWDSLCCDTVAPSCVFCPPSIYSSAISNIEVSILECKASSYKVLSECLIISQESYLLALSTAESEYSIIAYPIYSARCSCSRYGSYSLFYLCAIYFVCCSIKLCLIYYCISSYC